ncbi:MAG: DUF934 domain-containing protein [Rhodospirillales bacterium]|nr:DUF934 domain-containing protein [Rhodospirillales bacterium]
MPLIKDGTIVPDSWRTVADDAPLPPSDPVIISFARWQKDRDALAGRNGQLGIRLSSAQSPALIADDLHRFQLVALEFPKFTDGRAYSYARLLRERHGFKGELRAVGNVLRDQFLFMHRCGFDSFEVANERSARGWAAALQAISRAYQPAAEAGPSAKPLRWSLSAR